MNKGIFHIVVTTITDISPINCVWKAQRNAIMQYFQQDVRSNSYNKTMAKLWINSNHMLPWKYTRQNKSHHHLEIMRMKRASWSLDSMAFTSQPHISAAANQGFPNMNTIPSSLTTSGFKEALMKGTAVKESLNVIYVEEHRFQTQ